MKESVRSRGAPPSRAGYNRVFGCRRWVELRETVFRTFVDDTKDWEQSCSTNQALIRSARYFPHFTFMSVTYDTD